METTPRRILTRCLLLPATRYETFGIEDPRLAKLDDRFYFTYVAVSEHGAADTAAGVARYSLDELLATAGA